MCITKEQLIENPKRSAPHVVLLGAGASRAALPEGDANGKILPVMNDFITVLELEGLIRKTNLSEFDNFELFYSKLHQEAKHIQLKHEIEQRVYDYFESIALPNQPTIYDKLLLSLKETDAIFTFNWDPLLFDSCMRNRGVVPLPKIFFLHGNVRIGCCPNHPFIWGAKHTHCTECNQSFKSIPLLYPIEKKDYSADKHIEAVWDAAKIIIRQCITLTIIGYGAPRSDQDAVNIIKQAWYSESDRKFEGIEVLDIKSKDELYESWKSFTPTQHCRMSDDYLQTRIYTWPRRTIEALEHYSIHGIPCEGFPFPDTDDLYELQEYAKDIAKFEVS